MPLLTNSSSFATGGKFLPVVAIFVLSPVANFTRHLPPAYPGGTCLVANSDFSVARFLPSRHHWPSLLLKLNVFENDFFPAAKIMRGKFA